MKTYAKYCVLVLAIIMCRLSWAYELATTIEKQQDAVILKSSGYAKVYLIKESTPLKGKIYANGVIDVEGTANVVMWAKIDGTNYFSRPESLQRIKNAKQQAFTIPFDSEEKVIDEIVIEVELYGGGSVTIDKFKVN